MPPAIRTFEEFALVDVYTGDIDPVYFAIGRAARRWGKEWATRFAVGMLTYYDTGTALKAADHEGEDFWDYIADQYGTAPRAAERRHWRGAQGMRSLQSMRAMSPNPDDFFHMLYPISGFGSYRYVKEQIERKLVGFGAYFVLKICDYMDRCLDLPITNYKGLAYNLPTLPAQAAQLLYPELDVPNAFAAACERLAPLNLPAPPLFDRPLGPAEVETILCDWKRAKYGRHIVGDDVADKRKSMRVDHPKAEEMESFFPTEFPLTTFRCEL